jgi:hypothetical protein
MEHYYQNIQGWFNFQEIYSFAANYFPDGSNFLEIGSWKGTSTTYLGVELINRNKKNTKLYCIDPWEDTNDGEYKTESSIINNTLYDEFIKNINPLIKNNLSIIPIKDKSQNVYNTFNDNTFDFIYIDGSHLYENVKQDIINYLPKLKEKSLLAGHDWQSDDIQRAVKETLGIENIKTILNTWIYVNPKFNII